jgi:hypothetical protein
MPFRTDGWFFLPLLLQFLMALATGSVGGLFGGCLRSRIKMYYVWGLKIFSPDFGYRDAIIKCPWNAVLGRWHSIPKATYDAAVKNNFRTKMEFENETKADETSIESPRVGVQEN